MFVSLCSRDTGEGSHLVEQFIARKADILFCPTWKTAIPCEEELEDEEAAGEYTQHECDLQENLLFLKIALLDNGV